MQECNPHKLSSMAAGETALGEGTANFHLNLLMFLKVSYHSCRPAKARIWLQPLNMSVLSMKKNS